MANEDLDGSPPPEQIEELLPSRTTEEIVAALVSGNPKHSITLAKRVAQMTAFLKHEGPDQADDYQRLYELRVEQIGGDPDEMMTGNRPRYTMDEDSLAVKDHETGTVYPAIVEQDVSTVDEAPSQQTVEPETVAAVDECDHFWPDPVEAETPCSKCSLKFGQWAAA